MITRLKLEEIEYLISKLVSKLRNEGIEEITIENNSYWQVPIEQMFNLEVEPELHVGSILDDVSFLKEVVKEDFGSEYLEFERLASLLALLSKMYSYDRLKE